MKRRRGTDESLSCRHSPPFKRIKIDSKLRLLLLSDELILRILSFLSTPDLTRCERVNKRLRALAIDNEIWRERFFLQFVSPRARRLPSLKALSSVERERSVNKYSSKSAQWLGYSHMTPAETDWKRAFKIKFNWTQGLAKESELEIGTHPSTSALVKVHKGVIYTVDKKYGLRLWQHSRVTQTVALKHFSAPTAMTLHAASTTTILCVGFADGSLSLFSANTNDGKLSELGHMDQVENGSISCLALAWPYVLSVSSTHDLTLTCISMEKSDQPSHVHARRLFRLRSEAQNGPVSLALRKVNSTIVASIAYSFYRLQAGWCLGLQELRMDTAGIVTSSRLTSTVNAPMKDHGLRQPDSKESTKAATDANSIVRTTSRSAISEPFALHPQLMQPPNSLSFSGCYLVAGLSDNTLMVYTVVSTDTTLEINSGRRLWGHTSAVAAAEVTNHGKVLSISAKSDEMRYWELEDILSARSQRRTSTPIRSWEQVNKALSRRGNGLGLALQEVKQEAVFTRKWVGFDEEQAVILAERDQRQILSCFDFA